MKGLKHLWYFIMAMIFAFPSFAQDKCATDDLPVNKSRSVEKFEQWIKKKQVVQDQQSIQMNNRQFKKAEILQIPVVVHVVHQGEPVGTGGNISDEQIFSQIDVLNEDFRRLNADASNTPEIFQGVAADIGIEFVLARQDPLGERTNGIIRVNGSKNRYHPDNDNEKLTSESYWPAEDYFNIWVTDLAYPYLGYAQFPISDLEGLEEQNYNRLTDGVVIDYLTFGSKAKYPAANLENRYDLGRTVTHEVGHFLGLRHIWGDGGCSYDDYCEDTPKASKSNVSYSSCSFPGPNSCGNGTPSDLPDMFQNYMDYTDDKCMNLFTQDQKMRILTVMENSPRRASLTTSRGLVSLDEQVAYLKLEEIISPTPALCYGDITPELMVYNSGTLNIGSAQIKMHTDATIITKSFVFTDSLLPGHRANLKFDDINAPGSVNEILFTVVSVNGNKADDNEFNNISRTFIIDKIKEILPLRENFNDFESSTWQVLNLDNELTWELTDSFDEKSMSFPSSKYYNQKDKDWILSPVMDFSAIHEAALQFDLKYLGNTSEKLEILYTTDCGVTYQPIKYVNNEPYIKQGKDLNTQDEHNKTKREHISLHELIGYSEVRLAFVATSGYGSDIELDNFEVFLNDVPNPVIPFGKVVLFPNPTEGQVVKMAFKLEEREDIQITIMDYFGKVTSEYFLVNTLNQTHEIDMSSLPKGMYFVTISGQTFRETKKLINN